MNEWSANESKGMSTPSAIEDYPVDKKPSELWEWIKSIGTALVIVVIIHFFVFNLSTVKGQSMEPTLLDGEWLFINKIGYIMGGPDRGDIVILKDPSQQLGFREFLVKRIVGLPGDTIEVSNEKLYINGKESNEPYTDVGIQDGNYGPELVPAGHYFVMGDNRHLLASTDSRRFHSVPEKLIKGKAQFIMWPLNKIGGLYGNLPEE
jgi:signal peptidase I